MIAASTMAEGNEGPTTDDFHPRDKGEVRVVMPDC